MKLGGLKKIKMGRKSHFKGNLMRQPLILDFYSPHPVLAASWRWRIRNLCNLSWVRVIGVFLQQKIYWSQPQQQLTRAQSPWLRLSQCDSGATRLGELHWNWWYLCNQVNDKRGSCPDNSKSPMVDIKRNTLVSQDKKNPPHLKKPISLRTSKTLRTLLATWRNLFSKIFYTAWRWFFAHIRSFGNHQVHFIGHIHGQFCLESSWRLPIAHQEEWLPGAARFHNEIAMSQKWYKGRGGFMCRAWWWILA
jgi:hypothetical protein